MILSGLRHGTLTIGIHLGLKCNTRPERSSTRRHVELRAPLVHSAFRKAQVTKGTMAVAWKSTLNKALEANKQLKYSTFFQLATVRPDGKPSNRTVVFRGFLDDSTKITFTSDTRTFKVEHVKHQPWAEACWYFPDSREQFRLGGDLVVIGPDHPDAHLREARQDAWDNMGAGTRAWNAWPASGRPRNPDKAEFEKPVPDKGEEALPSFALVYMDVDTVDYVLLPNSRVGYGSTADKDGNRKWHEQELNP